MDNFKDWLEDNWRIVVIIVLVLGLLFCCVRCSLIKDDYNQLQGKYNQLLTNPPDCPECPECARCPDCPSCPKCEKCEECEECEEAEEIEDPDIIDDISFEDVMDLLRDTFPEAMIRGAELSDDEDDDFDAVEIEEIERFLDWDDTDELDLFGNRAVFRLHGQFMMPEWEKIPFGYAKESDGDIYNIVIVKDGKKLRVYEINPKTDRIKKLDEEEDVIFVVV